MPNEPEACDVRIAKLSLTVDPNTLPALFWFLQRGFLLEVQVGLSMRELLCGQLGLQPDYVNGTISTIILNGRPVDDLDAAIVNDGASLALSGATPGLVGAVMRSGSVLASFRSAISHRKKDAGPGRGSGMIRVKLFNLVMRELGPKFLQEGIFVASPLVADFFSSRRPELGNTHQATARKGYTEITLNCNRVDFEHLQDDRTFSSYDIVLLSAETCL